MDCIVLYRPEELGVGVKVIIPRYRCSALTMNGRQRAQRDPEKSKIL